MKNIFKSLMLVAVAAMAFTACEKDNNETAQTEQKTVITGVATIENDDTRSGFGDKVGTAYTSHWDGGEEIAIFYNDKVATTTIDAEGNFTAELEGEVSTITVCSPASAWSSVNEFHVTDYQTAGTNTVDPSAHILKSEATAVVGGVASVQMAHAVAYGKMTIGVPEGFAPYSVAVTINNEATYSIYGGENNTYWFATKPFAEVDTFTVAAFDVNGNRVEKTVNMEGVEKPLAFTAGRVSTFSVNGLAEKIEQIEFTDAEALIVGDKLNVTFSNTEHTLMVPFGTAAYDENGALKIGTWVLSTHIPSYDVTWDGLMSYSYYCSDMEVIVTDTSVTINFTWNGDKFAGVYNGTVAADLNAKAPLYYVYLYDYAKYTQDKNKDLCYTWKGISDLTDINNGLGFVFRNDNWDWYTITFNTNGNTYITPGTYTLGNGIVSEQYANVNWYNWADATSAEATVSFANNTYTFDVNIDYNGTVIEGTFELNLDDDSSLGVTAPAN